jgi:hypothetical protein
MLPAHIRAPGAIAPVPFDVGVEDVAEGIEVSAGDRLEAVAGESNVCL